MDNFDLKKYLNNNPLLKEENQLNENFIKFAKHLIKQKFGKSVDGGQIEADVEMDVDPKVLDRLLAVTEGIELDESIEVIDEDCGCESLEEFINEMSKPAGVTGVICHKFVEIVATFASTFPTIFGGDTVPKVLKWALAGKTNKFIDYIYDIRVAPGKYGSESGFIMKTLRKAKFPVDLFLTLVTLLIEYGRVVAQGGCKALLGVDITVNLVKHFMSNPRRYSSHPLGDMDAGGKSELGYRLDYDEYFYWYMKVLEDEKNKQR